MKLFNQKAPRGKVENITFNELPNSIEEFTALPQAALRTPFDTAALTVVALCVYPTNPALCFDMLNILRGPRALTELDQQFIAERFMEKDYIPRSYFEGATPANHYQPTQPYTLVIEENLFAYRDDNYADVQLKSGGSDFLRSVQLRQAKNGQWYLWEQYLLADIRMVEGVDPWK